MSVIDRNARTAERLRRNQQRLKTGAATGTIAVVAPISNSGDAIGLADDGVTEAKLADAAVTAAKLGVLTARGQLIGHDGTDHVAIPAAATAGHVVMATPGVGNGLGWNSIQTGNVAFFGFKGDLLTYDGANNQILAIGADGKFLMADAASPNGMKWETVSASVADDSITLAKLACLTTKGDLLVYDTDHARLGVGTNNYVLVADSAQAAGVKWAAIPVQANYGLSSGASGVAIKLDTGGSPGLQLSANGLSVKLANGLQISPAGSGVSVKGYNGITVDANGVSVRLLSGGGLDFSSYQLECRLNASGGIQMDASGLAIKLDGTTLAVGASGLKANLKAGGGLADSSGLTLPLTTKGDVLVYDTAHNRLAVGTNYFALCADSSVAAGLAYKSVVRSGAGVSSDSTVANTVTETNFSAPTVDASSSWWAVGKSVRITVWGKMSATGAAPTITLRLYGASGVLIHTVGPIGGVTGLSNAAWRLCVTMTVRATGAAGSIYGMCEYQISGIILSRFATTGLGLTVAPAPVVSAQWSAADAGNTVTQEGAVVEFLEA